MTLILFAIYALPLMTAVTAFSTLNRRVRVTGFLLKTMGAARGSVAPVVAVAGFAMCAALSLLAFESFAIPAALAAPRRPIKAEFPSPSLNALSPCRTFPLG